MSTVQAVKKAIKAFNVKQVNLSKYGALDGEVSGQMSHELGHYLAAPDHAIHGPVTWELYTASMNCNRANIALNKALAKIADAVVLCDDQAKTELKQYYFGA